MEKYETIRDAAEEWVRGFNAIPMGIVEKLESNCTGEFHEITPPSLNDRVYIRDDEHNGEYGTIVGTNYDDEADLYLIRVDGNDDEEIILSESEFDVEYDGSEFPMWGTMWSFGEGIDEDWAVGTFCESHLQEMADCGFRIYEQEDYGIVFGIDGAGYDFYESHWIPLYKARGLKWHKEV